MNVCIEVVTSENYVRTSDKEISAYQPTLFGWGHFSGDYANNSTCYYSTASAAFHLGVMYVIKEEY